MSRAADTVLVSGGFGQVGTRVVEILLGRGRTVVAADLRTEKVTAAADDLASRSWPGRLIVAYADLLDAGSTAELVEEHRPGAIVHLAAMYSPPSYRNPRLARRINVEGTGNLVRAAQAQSDAPLILKASSAAVYGSRNPYRYPELITPETPVNPIDQYGEDKVLAEQVIRDSGLPFGVLRLGGVISPDAKMGGDYLVLMRATPGDNRLHTVDARDVALAFANGVDRRAAIEGKTLLIAGDPSHRHTQRHAEDDMMETLGIGRLGPGASLPGDPDDDRGWSFTGWFDTAESQRLLEFQEHDWPATLDWLANSQPMNRAVIAVAGPVIRVAMRRMLAVQRVVERRGRYANPWALIEKKYGPDVIAPTNF